MPRLLIFILLAYLFFIIGKRLMHRIAQQQAKQKARSSAAKANNTNEKIVMCTRCGMHVPESETVLQDGQPVCKQSCKP